MHIIDFMPKESIPTKMISLSCICIMLFKTVLRINGLPLEFTITHPDDKLISTEGVSLLHVNFLQFDAKGDRDVTLTFHDAQFHIIIGGWGNTKSTLYIAENDQPDDEYAGPLLSSSGYKQFWMSWNSFQVYVGLGNVRGSGVILYGEPQCPIKVIDSTFTSNFEATLDYRVNQAGLHIYGTKWRVGKCELPGNSEYPCRLFLMASYRLLYKSRRKKYNRCHPSTRSVIEKAEETVPHITFRDLIRGNGRFCCHEKSCNTVNILSLVGSESRVECAVICKITPGCAFFAFNRNLKQCKIFGNDVGSDIVVSEMVYWKC